MIWYNNIRGESRGLRPLTNSPRERSASRLDGFAAFDARYAQSIFPDAHVVGKNVSDLFAACRRRTLRGLAEPSAPVRAVDVAEGNIAQAEFISAEHFNRKGSQTVYRPFGNCASDLGAKRRRPDFLLIEECLYCGRLPAPPLAAFRACSRG